MSGPPPRNRTSGSPRAFATVAGAAPLSCPEGIEPRCTLAEDPGDLIHALATGGEIVATGTPEEVALIDESHTGQALRSLQQEVAIAAD